MKKIILCIGVLMMICVSINAQIQSITSPKLGINFDKTVHLVFPMDVDYFNIGSDDVLGTMIETAPFVLKVKANNENFARETNISVITRDGKFYPFSINYRDSVQECTVFIGQDIQNKAEHIPVSASKSVHLFFPANVIYSDAGNEQAIEIENIEAANVVRFKAKYDSIPQTNLSVITADRKFYSFLLDYDPNPETFNYSIGELPIANIDNNEKRMREAADTILTKQRNIFNLGLSKNKMEFYCSNIYIKNNILYFCFGIKNMSTINFNVDFVKCFIRDVKQLKNTTIQETEMIPMLKHHFKEMVENGKENLFVIAFHKFTIPDKKKFEIEIFDKDGGRHLKFRIRNEHIITATKL